MRTFDTAAATPGRNPGLPRWCPARLSPMPRAAPMDKNAAAFWMTAVGTACWVACFWWMYRISKKQNSMLDRIGEQGRRIEKLSKVEHDLIKEVHPKVGEIKEGIDEMIAAVKENTESNGHPAPGKKPD